MSKRYSGLFIILVLSSLVLLPGCETAPKPKPQPAPVKPVTQAPTEQQAASLITAGKTREGVLNYFQVAKNAPLNKKVELYLLAGRIAFSKNLHSLAEQALSQLDALPNIPAQFDQPKRLFAARVALQNKQAERALANLNIDLSALEPAEQLKWLNLRLSALQQMQPTKAQTLALSLSQILNLTDKAEQKTVFAERLWEILQEQDLATLSNWQSQNSEEAAYQAWLQLAMIQLDEAASVNARRDRLKQWQVTHAEHPALAMSEALQQSLKQLIGEPREIAVLVSHSKTYDVISSVVTQGILSAYYLDNRPQKPLMRFYELNHDAKADVLSLYQTAVSNGAELVIGPINKASVEALEAAENLPVPILSLNYSEESTPNNKPEQLFVDEQAFNPMLNQFGLLPEDEAKSAAQKAHDQGYRHAALLVPSNSWGQRMANAFSQRFKALGGNTHVASFSGRSNDHSDVIKSLLGLDKSETRHQLLTRTLGIASEFEAQRRADIDVIFIAATPAQGRSLKPQLKFHQASDIPVFASSHISTGKNDARANRDLNGIQFTELPYLISQSQAIQALRSELNPYLSANDQRLPRLFALGMDAYNIIPHIDGMKSSDSLVVNQGLTGRIYIDKQQRLHRLPDWAVFEKGEAKVGQALAVSTEAQAAAGSE